MSQLQNQGYGRVEDDAISLADIYKRLIRHYKLIAIVSALVTAAAVIWVATRTPVYQANATLLLEADESAGGILSELASLTSDPAAESEIALLRSRSLAEVTAADPATFSPSGLLFEPTEPDFDPFGEVISGSKEETDLALASMDRMGLTTVVDSFSLRPYSGIVNRLIGGGDAESRLHARLAPLSGSSKEDRPTALDLYFTDRNTVLIAPHVRFLLAPELSSETNGVVEARLDPNKTIRAFGYEIVVSPSGEYVNQRYRVRRQSKENAVQTLMQRTSASEVGRKTNVVKVAVSDSCPYRAAETANAIAKNYIRRSMLIGRQKANRTLDFIKGQLLTQIQNLETAEKRFADLQSKNPETISLTESAKAIIQQLTSLELSMTQIQLAKTVLSEAQDHLLTGNFEALSRLGKETPNLLMIGYIQELATLETESLRLERTDIPGYKQLLQTEIFRINTLASYLTLEIASYKTGLAAIQAGDNSALGTFASGPTQGAWRDNFQSDLQTIGELDSEIAKLRGTSLPTDPALIALLEARSLALKSLSEHVSGALMSAEATLKGYEALEIDYRDSLKEWPNEERTTIEEAIRSLRERVKESLTSQIQGLDNEIDAIQKKISESNERLGKLPQSQLELAKATRDLSTYGEISAFLLKSDQEAQIAAAATSAAAVLIDPAVPPPHRKSPRATLLIALGALFGLVCGSALALAKSAIEASLYTESEVERASGLPIIGTVPSTTSGRTRIRGLQKGDHLLALRDATNGPQAEAYRAIRASLKQAVSGDKPLRSFAVTSCVPGEGKTTTNANLAIAFAMAGRKVLLVDGDLRKPTVHKLFNIDQAPGFAEVLQNKATWRYWEYDSGIENLSVVPAGIVKSNAGELLSSSKSMEVLEELLKDFDMVVFDLPPVLGMSDVPAFATHLDALVIVYRAGQVPGRVLTRTVKNLHQSGVVLVGVVINAVHIGRTGGLGNYGYGYGYGE